MRNKLIKVLNTFPVWYSTLKESWMPEAVERLADHLINHGVIASPVKVGDYVYYIRGGYCRDPKHCEVSRPCKVVEVSLKLQRNGDRVMQGFITDNGTRYGFDSIGKTVFLTQEDAEKALARRKGDA